MEYKFQSDGASLEMERRKFDTKYASSLHLKIKAGLENKNQLAVSAAFADLPANRYFGAGRYAVEIILMMLPVVVS